jgi:transcriptional regulator with XRE-family HTH domain
LVDYCNVQSQPEIKYLKNLGLRIRKYRIERNLSQEDLAFKCDYDISQINRMELGKVNAGILSYQRVAEALEINLCDLIEKLN